jgi:hypothetical protein
VTEEELKKLRAYYHSFSAQRRVFEDAAKHVNVESAPVSVLEAELQRIEADFPGFLPQFRPMDFYSHVADTGDSYYKISGIRSYLAGAIARLEVAIDTTKATPVTETREFSFVRNAELRSILERDYAEIQRAFVASCWKSVIILSGGAIEAILVDQLLGDPGRATASNKAPKDADISKWNLNDLVNVAVDLDYVSAGVEKLSHSVRDYRNLVHPGNEIRKKLSFGSEEARIALEVLHIVWRDLSK